MRCPHPSDLVAVTWFFGVWIGYSLVIEDTARAAAVSTR